MSAQILTGDCVEQMRELPACSIDAIVCDPPYGLGFMGKAWDSPGSKPTMFERKAEKSNRFDHVGGNHNPINAQDAARTRGVENVKAQEWHHAWATEALRILKPGGHLLAFGGTRTYHRLACAVEDAGFEIRDSLIWLYGSGFPKSLDVSKALDKAAGAEREVVGRNEQARIAHGSDKRNAEQGKRATVYNDETGCDLTAPATPEGQKWNGWGTALKPAHEPIVVARKPLSGTVAQNVTEHGTGALNIDGCRIGLNGEEPYAYPDGPKGNTGEGVAFDEQGMGRREGERVEGDPAGRWPANVALSPEAAAELDEGSGERQSGAGNKNTANRDNGQTIGHGLGAGQGDGIGGDSGGASRFFYCAKASRGERNAGLDGFEERDKPWLHDDGRAKPKPLSDPRMDREQERRPAANVHPTVKPIDLMRWLVRLVTPPGGTVLDPFTGSGTTGCAVVLEGFEFVGIEREEEYAAIAQARIEWWSRFPGESTDEILIRAGFSERVEREHRERGQLGLEGIG